MKTNDKSIRVSAASYQILVDIKKESGVSIKRIIHNFLIESLFYKKGAKNAKRIPH